MELSAIQEIEPLLATAQEHRRGHRRIDQPEQPGRSSSPGHHHLIPAAQSSLIGSLHIGDALTVKPLDFRFFPFPG